METKVCSKCKIGKTLNMFSKKGDKPQSYCKECHKEYRDQHYLNNREKYILKSHNYKIEFKEWFNDIRKNLKCSKCEESRWWVLDFHHRNPEEKDYNISDLVTKCSKVLIIKEVEKCDVLCSNCHRDLHYQQRSASNA